MISRSISDTQELAQKLAKNLPSRIFALTGDLGSGKTTFVQAFLRALGVAGRITSPTFLIIKNYRLQIKDLRFKRTYHIDCYRIKKPEELLNLGFKEILENPENIILIEWAEKVKDLLPKETFWLYFEHSQKENERVISLKTTMQ